MNVINHQINFLSSEEYCTSLKFHSYCQFASNLQFQSRKVYPCFLLARLTLNTVLKLCFFGSFSKSKWLPVLQKLANWLFLMKHTVCLKLALGHGHVFVHVFQGWIHSLFINYKIPFHYSLRIHPEFDVSEGPSEISRKK